MQLRRGRPEAGCFCVGRRRAWERFPCSAADFSAASGCVYQTINSKARKFMERAKVEREKGAHRRHRNRREKKDATLTLSSSLKARGWRLIYNLRCRAKATALHLNLGGRFGAASGLVMVITRYFNTRCYTARLETDLAPCRSRGRSAEGGSIGRSPWKAPLRHPSFTF